MSRGGVDPVVPLCQSYFSCNAGLASIIVVVRALPIALPLSTTAREELHFRLRSGSARE